MLLHYHIHDQSFSEISFRIQNEKTKFLFLNYGLMKDALNFTSNLIQS
jgi:hypothetical protein